MGNRDTRGRATATVPSTLIPTSRVRIYPPTFAGSSRTSNALFFLPPPEDCDGNPSDRNSSSCDNRERVVRARCDGRSGYAGGHDRRGRRLLTVHIDRPDDVVVCNAGLRGPIDIECGPGGGKRGRGEP